MVRIDEILDKYMCVRKKKRDRKIEEISEVRYDQKRKKCSRNVSLSMSTIVTKVIQAKHEISINY